jgi:putative endonuclease
MSFPHVLSGNPEHMYEQKIYYVYILVSKRNGTLYIGFTNDLVRRIAEHKEKTVPGFTKRYDIAMLVYYEFHEDVNYAIRREKQLKRWNRAWKLKLIEKNNPEWKDLYNNGEILNLPLSKS